MCNEWDFQTKTTTTTTKTKEPLFKEEEEVQETKTTTRTYNSSMTIMKKHKIEISVSSKQKKHVYGLLPCVMATVFTGGERANTGHVKELMMVVDSLYIMHAVSSNQLFVVFHFNINNRSRITIMGA